MENEFEEKKTWYQCLTWCHIFSTKSTHCYTLMQNHNFIIFFSALFSSATLSKKYPRLVFFLATKKKLDFDWENLNFGLFLCQNFCHFLTNGYINLWHFFGTEEKKMLQFQMEWIAFDELLKIYRETIFFYLLRFIFEK